ncbi:MAG: YihY/virulence factor BrkB family protein [Bacteroidetes bacterium]|nr:YihY/virulence factor BrkB family protein [Bacteroidota bacterium]
MLSIKETATLLKDTFLKFIDDRGIKLSAALAYYTIFSLPPLLILITAVTGFFYGQDAIEGRIYFQIQGMVGKEAALQVQEAIKNTTIDNNSNWATIVSIIALLFGATGVFSEIQDSINVIWGLKAKPKKGFIKLVINRLISFSMIITIGFLLLVSLILNALIDLFNERLQLLFPDLAVITFYVFNQLFMLSIITSLFITVFKVLPDAKINWRDVFVGSIFTSILFMAGKWIIGLYLGGSDVATAYGAAGSVIVILLWVYYSSIILFLGAEFTQIYALRHGKTIQPSDYAVFVVQKTEEITNPKDS